MEESLFAFLLHPSEEDGRRCCVPTVFAVSICLPSGGSLFMLHTVSLKDNSAFRRLYHRGASAANRWLVVYCRRNGLEVTRLGFTVSTKLGHAVVRNRIRRRLREIYRLNEAKAGYDIVVVVRSAALETDCAALTKALLSLLRRLELTEDAPQ